MRCALLLLLPGLAEAGDTVTKFIAPDAALGDQAGSAVAIVEGRLAVGAPRHDLPLTDSGAVYLYDPTSGSLLVKLSAPGAQPGQRFGVSLAHEGSRLLIGSATGDRVEQYDLAAGSFLTGLEPGDAPAEGFGASLDALGGLAVVGAPNDSVQGLGAGSAYLFDAQTGLQLHRFTPSAPSSGDLFGRAVALGPGVVAVGAPLDDGAASNAGRVSLFDPGTGQLLTELVAPDAAAGSIFGRALAIEGDLLVIGAPGHADVGAVYVYDLTAGAFVDQLLPPGSGAQGFGVATALQGGLVLTGAFLDNAAGAASGSAHVHQARGGEHLLELSSFDGAEGDNLGRAVATDGTRVLVGAWLDDGVAEDEGSAYSFPVRLPLGQSYCGPAVPNSTGASAALTAAGMDLAFSNCVTLSASSMPPNRFGLFLNGTAEGQVMPPGSQGRLCLSGELGRYAADLVNTGTSGTFTLPLDLTSTPTPGGPVAVQPGETWRFQAWYRDLDPGPTSNFTDALRITFH